MNLPVAEVLEILADTAKSLGSKMTVALGGQVGIVYLTVAGYFVGQPWYMVLGVIFGIVAICGLFNFARLRETELKAVQPPHTQNPNEGGSQ